MVFEFLLGQFSIEQPAERATDANPDGIPIEVFDGMRAAIKADRAQFWKEFAKTFTAPTDRA